MNSQNLSHYIIKKCVVSKSVTEHSFFLLFNVTQKNHVLEQDGRGPGVHADQPNDHQGENGISLESDFKHRLEMIFTANVCHSEAELSVGPPN